MRRKLLLSLLLIVIAVLLIWPWISGKMVKYSLLHGMQQMTVAQKHVNVSIQNYEEGWFTSHFTLTITPQLKNAKLTPPQYTGIVTVYHGPILRTHALQHPAWFGHASFQGQLTGNSPLLIFTQPIALQGSISFTDHLFVTLLAQNIRLQPADHRFQLLVGNAEDDIDSPLGSNTLQLESILQNIRFSYPGTQPLVVILPSAVIDYARLQENGVWVEKMKYLIPELTSTKNQENMIRLQDLKLTSSAQWDEAQTLSGQLNLTIDHVYLQTDDFLQQLKLSLEVNQLNLANLQRGLMILRQESSEQVDPEAIAEMQKQVLLSLPGMVLKVKNFSAITPYGPTTLSGFLAVTPPDVTQLTTLKNPVRWVFTLKLPQNTLQTIVQYLPIMQSLTQQLALPPGSPPIKNTFTMQQLAMAYTAPILLKLIEGHALVPNGHYLKMRISSIRGLIYLNGKLFQPKPQATPVVTPTPASLGNTPHATP